MAEASIITLTDWPQGVVLPKGSHLQEANIALRALSDATGFDRRHPHAAIRDGWRLAIINSTGPNNEADYDDERYFVALQAITDADRTDTLQIEDDFSDGYQNDKDKPTNIVTATNISEWRDGSHGMVSGDLIWVKGKVDLGTPQQVHWSFQANVGNLFIVNVEKDGGAQGTNAAAATWTYTVRRLGRVIGNAITLSRPRPFGTATFQAGSSGFALAFYGSDQQLYLWDAGETYGSAHCVT